MHTVNAREKGVMLFRGISTVGATVPSCVRHSTVTSQSSTGVSIETPISRLTDFSEWEDGGGVLGYVPAGVHHPLNVFDWGNEFQVLSWITQMHS